MQHGLVVRLRRLVALVAAAAVAAGSVVATAQAGGANNVVQATTTADGAALGRSGVEVAPVGADTVTSTNLALADARDCLGCRSVAVAFQTVLITRDASEVTPTNAAVATTANCSGCVSYAFAFQYGLSTDGPVLLDVTGRQELADLRRRLADTVQDDVPLETLDASVRQLAAEFKDIIDRQLRRAGRTGAGTVHEQADRAPGA